MRYLTLSDYTRERLARERASRGESKVTTFEELVRYYALKERAHSAE